MQNNTQPKNGKNKKVKEKRPDSKQKQSSNQGLNNQYRAGDWVCLVCNNLNFSFRNQCNRCKMQSKKQNYVQNLISINDKQGNFGKFQSQKKQQYKSKQEDFIAQQQSIDPQQMFQFDQNTIYGQAGIMNYPQGNLQVDFQTPLRPPTKSLATPSTQAKEYVSPENSFNHDADTIDKAEIRHKNFTADNGNSANYYYEWNPLYGRQCVNNNSQNNNKYSPNERFDSLFENCALFDQKDLNFSPTTQSQGDQNKGLSAQSDIQEFNLQLEGKAVDSREGGLQKQDNQQTNPLMPTMKVFQDLHSIEIQKMQTQQTQTQDEIEDLLIFSNISTQPQPSNSQLQSLAVNNKCISGEGSGTMFSAHSQFSSSQEESNQNFPIIDPILQCIRSNNSPFPKDNQDLKTLSHRNDRKISGFLGSDYEIFCGQDIFDNQSKFFSHGNLDNETTTNIGVIEGGVKYDLNNINKSNIMSETEFMQKKNEIISNLQNHQKIQREHLNQDGVDLKENQNKEVSSNYVRDTDEENELSFFDEIQQKIRQIQIEGQYNQSSECV